MVKFVVLLALFSLTSHADEEVDGAADSIVKVGYVNCGKPYNQYQNGQLSGGLVYEVARKITERANFSPAFLELPPLRVTEFLKRGEVQMVCFYNAKWTPEPEAFLWGPPLATYREFFIVRAGDALNDHAQLRGKTIATHQGYFYSDQLMTFFKSGVARRVEHTDTAHLYQLLALNRVDAIVDNEFSFHAM
ncbi:MAG: transporter substrate-binding domain-containing protein, partial [Pseudomonadales bacterium]|nr:transporter substrate-binding domain-containing protein [Pseudomonadales bacterium]